VSSAVLNLTDRQLAALIERGHGWPWNGYELRLMKEAGKYPPARRITRKPRACSMPISVCSGYSAVQALTKFTRTASRT
jgi:hypothetical protein